MPRREKNYFEVICNPLEWLDCIDWSCRLFCYMRIWEWPFEVWFWLIFSIIVAFYEILIKIPIIMVMELLGIKHNGRRFY